MRKSLQGKLNMSLDRSMADTIQQSMECMNVDRV
jgi:hypothetical protein